MAKRQADYTLSDVVRLDPKWLRNKQREERLSVYDNHILFLSQMMSAGRTQIAEYPFLEVFPSIDITRLEIPDINKALFIYEEASRPPVEKRMDNPNLARIREAANDGKLTQTASHFEDQLREARYRVSNLESTINDSRRDAENHYKEYLYYENKRLEHLKNLELKKIDVEVWEDKVANFNGGLDPEKIKVLKTIPKHFRILMIDSQSFTVANIKPIILTETNSAAGVNRTLNMGHFTFRFNWKMQYKGIAYLADNIQAEAKHPHVSGYICWGNLQSLAANKLDAEDYVGWWSLFDQLLCNYNSGSPFYAWGNYVKRKNSYYKAITTIDEYKKVNVYEEIYRNTNSSRYKEAYEKMVMPKRRNP